MAQGVKFSLAPVQKGKCEFTFLDALKQGFAFSTDDSAELESRLEGLVYQLAMKDVDAWPDLFEPVAGSQTLSRGVKYV